MPRQVDYEWRRRQLIDAVYALADEEGLEGVTLRNVADRAGVSAGAVQRSFRDKDEMLALALAQVSEQFSARVRAAAAAPPPSALTQVAAGLALLGDGRRPEAQVWLAFVARAAVTPALAQILKDGYPGLHEMLAGLIREAAALAGTTVDAELEARTLLALADGLTVQVLLGQVRQQEAEEILDAYLARLR